MKLLETILCWAGLIIFGLMFGFALVGCAPRPGESDKAAGLALWAASMTGPPNIILATFHHELHRDKSCEADIIPMAKLKECVGPVTKWDDAIRERKLASRHAAKMHHRQWVTDDHNRRVVIELRKQAGQAVWSSCAKYAYAIGSANNKTMGLTIPVDETPRVVSSGKANYSNSIDTQEFAACLNILSFQRHHGL